MTAVTRPPAPATTVPAARPHTTWAAVLALARFEARGLLLRLPVLVAFAVYTGWTLWRTPSSWNGYPALQDADRATQSGALLIGLAVLLCANQAVLRSRRHDTERHFAVCVLPPWRRTVAHLLSVVPAALLTAVCVGGQFTWEALKPGAVGHGSPGELLVGPLAVLLFGAAGVLLARVVPGALAAPLLIVLALSFAVLGTGFGGEGRTRWLAPVVGENSTATLPSDLLGRPAAWHALYLTGLALSLALVAVLLSGGLRLRTVQAGLAGAVALTMVGAVAQSGEVPAETSAARTRASVSPEKVQDCTERDGTTYCVYPEWGPRVRHWAPVVDRVRSLAGATAADRPLLVRQRVEARYGLSGDAAIRPLTRPGEVTVGTAWGGNRVPEFSVAVAGVLVAGRESEVGALCDGRMVTVMWLGLAGRPDPLGDLRGVRLDDSTSGAAVVVSRTEPLSMTGAHTELVRELLERPRDAVAAKVRANWAELTTPKVTTGRVAELLGLPAPAEPDECL
ncbi:ABC transporter permease [Streptomyces sp. NPDC052012]|uniref:ABC transporter permease n=1 Tax=Streptomyces sp. NPDC052012 TaxID=3155051 RepID=UPI00344B1B37